MLCSYRQHHLYFLRPILEEAKSLDTGTHVVMGIALGALATVDPVVAGSSQAAIGIMTATIIGSQIPDIDTVLKLKKQR